MSRLEAFLDDTPGEVRGIVMRDGRPEHLIIYRDSDDPQLRLGARSVGRVIDAPAGLKGAFVELNAASAPGFMPLKANEKLTVGAKVEVEVTAERRESKGVTLRMLGAGEGAPRLLSPAPSIPQILERLAPGVEPLTGRVAIEAGLEAAEDAASGAVKYPDTGLDLMVERTRAMITVDLDLAPAPGSATGGKARDRANCQGLREAARIIRLRRWAGLVAVDLIGVGHESSVILAAAREAFGGDPDIVYGPINRFGVLHLALPWRMTPLEEVLDPRSAVTRAQAVVRRLKLELISDTTRARVTVRCAPDEAALAAPLAAALGPRAAVRADPDVAPGAIVVEEG